MMKRTISDKDRELSKQKIEKLELIGQRAKEQSDKEKRLTKDVDMLKAQLEFKNKEILDRKESYKKLEDRIKNMDASSTTETTPKKHNGAHPATAKPSTSSRNIEKTPVKSPCPNFHPNKHSFWSTETAQKTSTRLPMSTQNARPRMRLKVPGKCGK